MDSRTLVKHELIGLPVVVVAATDPTQIGVTGLVVDETRNTMTIEADGVAKMIPKRGTTFRFRLERDIDIEGERILFRPEDRIKRAG